MSLHLPHFALDDTKEWDPVPFLSPSSRKQDTGIGPQLKTALVIINTPIVRKDVFETIWKNCRYSSFWRKDTAYVSTY